MINPVTEKPARDDALAMALLQVDVIADFACPWCYLGKRRLDDALMAVHGPSAVAWHPFQLNPDLPEQGRSFEEYLASRFGGPQAVQALLAELASLGKVEGIAFRFDRVSKLPNTLDAHRLMKLAETEGANPGELAEHLMTAYFEEGLDISAREVLVEIGQRSGFTSSAVNRILDDEISRQAVLSQEAQVRRSGVSGVPDFLVNRRLFVIGAQTTESLVRVFDRAMFGEESDRPVSATLH